MPIEASRWRPPQHIRVVAIGIASRDDTILTVWVPDDDGRIKGARPPGGAVEFGERVEAALAREFREELATDVTVVGAPIVLENHFAHHDAAGHEIVFAYPIRLHDVALYRRDRLALIEDNGDRMTAEWVALDRFRDGSAVLFPEGLLAQLPALLSDL